MTRQIIALLILVALIAGIFRAIQQSTLNQQGSIPSETNSISTAPVPSATRSTSSLVGESAGTNDGHNEATMTTMPTLTLVINTPATVQPTTWPTITRQTGSRPSQFPNTGLIDEYDVFRRPVVALGIVAGIIAIIGYLRGRRR